MAKSKYKPLSFSTTMRNPERIGALLGCLLPFENRLLTNGVIDGVIRLVIKNKLYKPFYVDRTPILKSVYYDEDGVFSDSQITEIMKNSPQNHKEAGFDKGWPSRFDTIYKLAMEFGFVYYEMNQPIVISGLGHMLIDAVSDEHRDDQKIHDIFLNVMVRYQSKNPFRKTLTDNVPLILLLKVINRFKSEDPSFSGIFRSELGFFVCWPNNDYESLYRLIKSLRQRYGVFGISDEVIYEKCLELLGYDESGKDYIKLDRVIGEATDEYIRKMRITGILSLRGNGRFLDWNTLESEKITYVLNNYQSYCLYSDKKAFFDYMGTVDPRLFSIIEERTSDIDRIRSEALNRFVLQYDKDFVFSELQNVCKKKESKDELLRYIPAPARLEFLTAIALKQNFTNLRVMPNYPVDDEGIPTSTASGGMADIECRDEINELIEVTLLCGRNQVIHEMLPITRHLSEIKERTKENAIALFIAPSIHADANQYCDWLLFKDRLEIRAFDIDRFISSMKKSDKLCNMYASENGSVLDLPMAAEEITPYSSNLMDG